MPAIHQTIGFIVQILAPDSRPRDERGLSQSTENAILLAGAAGIAVAIIAFITKYVADRMPGA